MTSLRIAIGADDNGYLLKEEVKKYLTEKKFDYEDFGTFSADPVDYPDIGAKVARAVADGKFDRGILVCGTGIGMAIVANKIPGIRAACCHDAYSAERARKSNNAQIMTMGALIIGKELAKKILDMWLASEFDAKASPGSARKVNRIMDIEEEYLRKP